jgi:hypothetical protein
LLYRHSVMDRVVGLSSPPWMKDNTNKRSGMAAPDIEVSSRELLRRRGERRISMRTMIAIAFTVPGLMFLPLLQGCSSSQSSPSAQTPSSAPQAQAQPPTQQQVPNPPSAKPGTKPAADDGAAGEQNTSSSASPSTNPAQEKPQPNAGGEADAAQEGGSSTSSRNGGGGDSPQPTGVAAQGGSRPDGSQGGSGAGNARTDKEQTTGLDRKLERSLEEFDGLLLEEQQRVAEAAGAARSGSSGSGGSGSGAAGQTGEGAAAADSNTGRDADATASGGSPDAPTGKPGEQQSGAAGATSSREDEQRPPIPSDIGDGGDDDVIARQLREAAMSEKDPELREKLWQEYRDYKESLGGKTRDNKE